ncbi:MAG TPA: alkaline phosphatase D family protein [Polyangiaceae bacterium]|nr:alkaline phosphatase D family protein [Polyangiaceae bacterium]
MSSSWSRRRFIRDTALGGASLGGLAGVLHSRQAPAQIIPDAGRPSTAWGMQIGDVLSDRAIVWSRTDRPARLNVEWSLDERFRRSTRVRGPNALDVTDFTARLDLDGLPPGEDIFVRLSFEGVDASGSTSEPILGRFRTAPERRRNIRFLWSGDTAGQGWGIDLEFGGMKIYEAMRQTQPDFFIHSGDTIYADGPMLPEVTDATGNVVWRNAYLDQVPEKLKVAETLHEYRRAHLYNRYDANVRAFSAEVPQIWQWDDHEVTNNWSSSKLVDTRYTETSIRALVANGTRAFLEYAPMRWSSQVESERVYRHIPYGPDLDVFVLDMRSYRGPNACNLETEQSAATAFLGKEQLEWLERSLARSRATWKIIAADMPIGLVVADGTDPETGCTRAENSANGDGPVLGREHDIARVLSFIKHQRVRGVVWLTADVHYCAAHFYDPARAQFKDFEPFWEFVAGPLHSGTFGPNALDDTFGPSVAFQSAPPEGQSNLSPSAGLQFFGQVDIDAESQDLTVALKDIEGRELYRQRLRACDR